MARPVKADAEKTQRRILDAALEMFSESGIDGVSIRRIAESAGVSLAMVHHYFGSKDELYEACIDSMYQQLVALEPHLMVAFAKGGAMTDVVGRLVGEAFRFAREHQVPARLLMRQTVAMGELDSARQQTVQLPFLDKASALLGMQTGRPAAEFRLPLQTLSFAVARYGISTQSELERFSGKQGAAAVRFVEDHLKTIAVALLASSSNSPPN